MPLEAAELMLRVRESGTFAYLHNLKQRRSMPANLGNVVHLTHCAGPCYGILVCGVSVTVEFVLRMALFIPVSFGSLPSIASRFSSAQ